LFLAIAKEQPAPLAKRIDRKKSKRKSSSPCVSIHCYWS